jgi:hypothetical protein
MYFAVIRTGGAGAVHLDADGNLVPKLRSVTAHGVSHSDKL